MSEADVKAAVDMTGFARVEYDINGVKIVVHSIGSGPEFVFLHGTGTFTGFEFARALSARREVIIPTTRISAIRATTPRSIRSKTMSCITWTCRSPRSDQIRPWRLLWGWLAAEFAIRQPYRLRRLVLVAPAGLVVEKARAPELSEITPPELPSYLANDPQPALRYFPNAPDPDFDARLGREIGAYAQLVRDNPQGNPKLARWLHRIGVPTLLLWALPIACVRRRKRTHRWIYSPTGT